MLRSQKKLTVQDRQRQVHRRPWSTETRTEEEEPLKIAAQAEVIAARDTISRGGLKGHFIDDDDVADLLVCICPSMRCNQPGYPLFNIEQLRDALKHTVKAHLASSLYFEVGNSVHAGG